MTTLLETSEIADPAVQQFRQEASSKAKKHRSKAEKRAGKQRKLSVIDDPFKHKCQICDCLVPNAESNISIHYTSKAHVRLEKLYLYAPFFEEHGLFLDSSRKKYTCNGCGRAGILADAKKLKEHLLNVHFLSSKKKYTDTLRTSGAWYSGEENLVAVSRVHKVRPKVYWTEEFNLDEELGDFEEVAAPTLCIQTGVCGFHFLLVNGRFTSSALTMMTELGTFLEAKGCSTKRGEMKRVDYDARIVTFGYRYAYGEIGRFRHNVQGCYYRADQLASLICDHLEIQFPNIFEHLENVLKEEGITADDNIRLGNTPFTTMSITKNYHCNIHTDIDDVSYGFFIWFGQNGTKDEYGNEVKFYFPGVKLFTIPLIGDVLLCKSNELWHCTRTVGDRGQFGIALYQKSSFFRWYSILKGKIQDNIIDKLVLSWFDGCDIEY